METNKLFEDVESRKDTSNFVLGSGSTVISNSWGTISGWNPAIVEVKKKTFFGVTLWRKITEISPDVFFQRLKKTKQEIKIIDGIVDKYFKQISQAEKLGQIALVERLRDDI